MNRSALIRIPKISNERYKSTRIELRSPDPSSNPYLLLATILSSGMYGIEKKIKPPQPVEENVYKLKSVELLSKNIGLLPRSLFEALEYYSKSKLLK